MDKPRVARKLREHVDFLCTECYPRNFENPKNKGKAVEYILEYLRENELKPLLQEYRLGKTAGEIPAKNIIVEFGDKSKPAILFGSHFDSCCDTPGADDNASGVAVLLEMARYFSITCNFPKRVILVFFDNEEPPCFGTDNMGSFRHAKMMREQKEDIEYMIALEMVGYFKDPAILPQGPLGMVAGLFPKKADFLALISKNKDVGETVAANLSLDSKVPVLHVHHPKIVENSFDLSDNSNYQRFGFTSFMLTDGAYARNPHYHLKSDTPDTLDYERMAEIVQQLTDLITGKPRKITLKV